MKKWNKKNNKTATFSELANPIANAIRFAYNLERKNIDKDIKWTGYDIGEKEKTTCFSPDEKFTAESLAFALEDQGREALEEIITVAIQLGIEQGRRIHKREIEAPLQTIKYMIDGGNKELKKI
ncbi:MAG: hypothetical protein GY804_09610 [Alphaproteobacteria bacterium]|nr:hypothetical protein [Alphaproteobacteria bacterium]